jgi:uncharacterized protein
MLMKASTFFLAALLFIACTTIAQVSQDKTTELPVLAESDFNKSGCQNTQVNLAQLSKQSSPKAAYFVALCLQQTAKSNEDLQKAFNLLYSAANKGYQDAMYQLSMAYASGQGVSASIIQSLDWNRSYEKLKFKDHEPEAILLVNRSTTEKTNSLSLLSNLEKKAKSGGPDAQFMLAKIHDRGQWAKPDLNQAIYWYIEAAKNKHDGANQMMGYFYCKGIGVEKNISTANKHFQRSTLPGKCR